MAVILCVDDDVDFCLFLQSFFAKESIELVFVQDIESAKEVIMQNPYRFIILDKNLPDGSGIELAAWIRLGLQKETPLCLITSEMLSLRDYEYLKEELKVKFVLSKPLSERIASIFLRELLQHITDKATY